MQLRILEGSQSSESSIDSSQFLSIYSSFESTQSLDSVSIRPGKPMGDGQDEQKCGFESPKEKTRFHHTSRQSELFCGFQQPMFGFVGMGKGKPIQINESKLKRAKQFMQQDDEITFNFPSPTFGPAPTSTIIDKEYSCHKSNEELEFDFSMGFRSLGTGALIKVSEQATNKVKQMFQQLQPVKQTKSKQPIQHLHRTSNFTKTDKVKPSRQIKVMKKPAIDSTEIVSQVLASRNHQYYIRIKLAGMLDVSWDDIRKFQNYWRNSKWEGKHSTSDCQVKWCYFCQKYKDKSVQIDAEFIQDELSSLIKLSYEDQSRAACLMRIVVFKLARYSYFDPSLFNKRLNPSNVILELYRKFLAVQKQAVSPLQQSISSLLATRSKTLGKHLLLVVLSVAYSKDSDLYFIELSDGWITIFAVLSSTSLLAGQIGKKIVVGAKLEIVNWNIHPVCNILECHPDPIIASWQATCIQISYNNCRPSGVWAKLGWSKQPFYRSVSKCQESGGPIPLVEGIILRMFTIKTPKFSTNFVEILLSEGNCILMKVTVADQVSLVELFRLYYCYHFCRVKKVSSYSLEFTGASKYYEVEDKKRIEKVTQIFKQRLLNTDKNQKLPEMQESDTCYIDIITKQDSITIGGANFKVDEKIQGIVLLQQYTLRRQGPNFVMCKGDRGSCLKRIPKLYENIEYQSF